MAYYPPYVPESYLLQMRYIPTHSSSVKRIERIEKIEKKHINQYCLEAKCHWPKSSSKESGKGFHIDLYA